jgi:glycosyltransferase involved in cell wall biosynthesis
MKPRAIHQFHASSAYADGVTNGLLFTRQLLRELGYPSQIYVEHVARELKGEVTHYKQYDPSPDQVLFVHHSQGHNLFGWLATLPDVKVLVYHNITPAHFFSPGSLYHTYSQIGRRQLRHFKAGTAAAICDSPFNAQELLDLGFANVAVIPMLLDVEAIRHAPWNPAVVDAHAGVFTMLFVGRIVENKCQHHVLEVFRHLQALLDRPARLVLIGQQEPHAAYPHSLRQRIREYGLKDHVQVLGQVGTADLYGWYRAADVFVSMSEHEGFGIPLVEAMAFHVPVVAFGSTNIPYTLGGAGILIAEKRFEETAALIARLARDRALRRSVVQSQRERLRAFAPAQIRRQLARALEGIGVEVPRAPAGASKPRERRRFQIEGPFETSYSLAIVNRELAFALDEQEPGSVALFATEGPGDYPPDLQAIAALPGLARLHRRGRKGSLADVVIRNLYPPRVADMDGVLNLLYFAWEESNLPRDWVRSFNRHLDGIAVLSTYVKKVLIDAGVHVPIHVAGCGIDQVLRERRQTYDGELGKAFRFLHISSCFPRKGVDVLLKAYAQAFTSADDVSLVLKTFPNIHNTVEEQIRELQAARADCPDIVLINRDLPTGCVIDLYHRCHAFVAPTRGEGFGLPMAEAMLFGLPVLTTAYGGQADFCTEETCWTIDFSWQPARSHMGLHDSVWAEPDAEHLSRRMREVYACPGDLLRRKVRAARAKVLEQFTWRQCAARVTDLVNNLSAQAHQPHRRIRVAWVTTWNAKCGIASYSSYLISRLPPERYEIEILASTNEVLLREDDDSVKRCWGDYRCVDLAGLEEAILGGAFEVVVIQFNWGFFRVTAFGDLIEKLHRRGLKVIVVFHSTQDVDKPELKASLAPIKGQLALADRLLVHGVADLNRLKDVGLVHNALLFPMGVLDRPAQDPAALRSRLGLEGSPVVATYGFLLPNKGVPELIRAFPEILAAHPGAVLLLVNALYPIPLSEQLRSACRQLLEELGLRERVILINDYLADDEAICLLECADLVVFPYQHSGESASAAVKNGLASNRPVACTPLEIFSDVRELCHFLPGTSPRDLAKGINELLACAQVRHRLDGVRQGWLQAHSWQAVAERLDGLLRALVVGPASAVDDGGVRDGWEAGSRYTDKAGSALAVFDGKGVA